MPAVIDIPYVVAGMGASHASVNVANDGGAPIAQMTWKVTGDATITLGNAPASLDAGAKGTVELTFAGAADETIAKATLSLHNDLGDVTIPVFAVAGDRALGASGWADVLGPGGVVQGSGATVAMPAAPYPDAASSYTDPSVRVFLPDGYRERGAEDMVVHFHGFNTTLAATLATHQYEGHVYASGANVVLVVPQGPVNAPSGDFGKLMKPGGLSRLEDEILVLLYRDGKISYPVAGDLTLTSHSGGDDAVAANLPPASPVPAVRQIDLFDSIYGWESTFEGFASAGGSLRSDYTPSAGTLTNNQDVATWLTGHGIQTADTATHHALRDAPAVVFFADTTHDGSTRIEGAYGEELRWKARHSRRGPRIELRSAVASGNAATVTWLSPVDDDVTGFVVETSPDEVAWSTVATVSATTSSASFPFAAGIAVRVKSVTTGVAPSDVLPSNTYRVAPSAKILVVDGFERVLDGGFGGLRHDFAAVVGAAAGMPVATISHRAITEDGLDLSPYRAIVWVGGDESIDDHSISPAEQQALTSFVDAGGALIVSGSEVAWELSQTTPGAAFLDHCFGAAYVADNSHSYTVDGVGALAALPAVIYGGVSAPYFDAYPDVLGATPAGQVVLRYRTGTGAGVGIAGHGALVGFPLELIDDPTVRAATVAALLKFAGV